MTTGSVTDDGAASVPRPRWAGAGAAALVPAIGLGTAALMLVIVPPHQGPRDTFLYRAEAFLQGVGFLILAVTGAVLLHRRPTHAMGWLLSGAGTAQLVTMAIIGFASLAAVTGDTLPDVLLWATNWVWVPAQVGVHLVLLRFPDGRLPGKRWRVVEYAVLTWGLITAGTTALLPGPVGPTNLEHLHNPYGWEAAGPVLHGMLSPLFLVLPLLTVACAAAPVLRWRRAAAHDRQQLRWVAAAAALTVVAAPLVLLGTESGGSAVLALATLLLPAAIAVAVLRRRLWELGVLARSVLAAGVTGTLLIAAYVAVVRWVDGPLVPLFVGLLVAAVAVPVHRLVRRLLDVFLLGTKGDPAAVARDLRRQLRSGPVDTLRDTASRLAYALRLPWVGFEDVDGAIVAQFAHEAAGTDESRAVHSVPIITGGQRVGRLLAHERATGEGLSPRDVGVLTEVAAAVALLMRTAHADDRLADSRRRLGTVRREERARLQRDLHDGLAPVLGGITLRAEAARNLLDAGVDDGRRIVTQLDAIGTAAEGAVAEIRRLIDELRPTALGEAGLVEAIRLGLESIGDDDGVTFSLDLHPPAELDSRVEVAAYRIVMEAVRNAVRHSAARCVRVEGRRDGPELLLEVIDDGRGLGDFTPGVGMRAMTERAAELGGSLVVGQAAGGGAAVVARLPLAPGVRR